MAVIASKSLTVAAGPPQKAVGWNLNRILSRAERRAREERRRYKRLPVDSPVVITWRADGSGHKVVGICLDFSQGGARLKTDAVLPVSTEVHLKFPDLEAEADGVVRNARGDSIGVEFAELTYYGLHKDPEPPRSKDHEKNLIAVLGFALVFALAYAVPGVLPEWVPFAKRTDYQYAKAPGFFTLGSTRSDVYAVQGPPTRLTESAWYYGSSQVLFRDNVVVGWKVSPNQPLSTGTAQPKSNAADLDAFTVGATADEVLAAQGPPAELTDDVWKYGASEVYFRNGRVVGWRNTTEQPLKARPSTVERRPST